MTENKLDPNEEAWKEVRPMIFTTAAVVFVLMAFFVITFLMIEH